MGTCLWKVSLSSSQQTHFEKQNKEQPYNQALWNSQTLLSGWLLKGWRRIPRNCNSTPRDRDACGSKEMPFQRSLVYQTLMHHALLFSLTLFFGKLNHLSPPIAFSVPTGWFSPQQDTLAYFLCTLWYRARMWAKKQRYMPSLLLFQETRQRLPQHNTPDHAEVSSGDAILEKNSYLPSQQLVTQIWRWEATQVLPRLREKSDGFLNFLCLFTWPYLYSQTTKTATMQLLKGKNYVAHYLST